MRATAIFRLLLLIVLFTVVGCAQLPIGGAAGGVGLPEVRDMPACGVSVRFSGYPEKLSADQVQSMTKPLGEYAKWEIAGWQFTKHRLSELAVCACRDFPLTAAEFEASLPAIVTNSYVIAGIGDAVEREVIESTERKLRQQWVWLKHAPSCLLVQSAIAPEPNNAATAYFATLTLMPTPNAALRSPAQPPGGSIAERLRQLDQLLKDRLISQNEYNKQRSVVLESL